MSNLDLYEKEKAVFSSIKYEKGCFFIKIHHKEILLKTYKNLYRQVYSFDNLYLAYEKAIKRKRWKKEVMLYSFNLEENLFNLQNSLINYSYQPGEYKEFMVYVPKERLIKSLPFSDRVLQHAVNNILEPIFQKTFYEHSYACVINKGPIQASEVVSKWVHNYSKSGKKIYCLKCDISKYFASVDLRILFNIYSKRIKDKDFLNLLYIVFELNKKIKELPVGNLTSQLSGNVYLTELDNFITNKLKPFKFIRYMDDFLLFSDSKEKLARMLKEIEWFLEHKLHLKLNNKTRIFPINCGVDFVGYVHYPNYKRMRKSTWKRSKKMLRKDIHNYLSGKISYESLRSKFSSLTGRLKYSNSFYEIQLLTDFYNKLIEKEGINTMQGIPKRIATKQDIINLVDMAKKNFLNKNELINTLNEIKSDRTFQLPIIEKGKDYFLIPKTERELPSIYNVEPYVIPELDNENEKENEVFKILGEPPKEDFIELSSPSEILIDLDLTEEEVNKIIDELK